MHKRNLALVLIAAFVAFTAPHVARAAQTAPAIDAFNASFAQVTSYTFKLHSHETKGSDMQDRVYDYSFMKPHFAKTLIESGDSKGSGGVWTGGDQVSGHQGGFLSGIHLRRSVCTMDAPRRCAVSRSPTAFRRTSLRCIRTSQASSRRRRAA